MENKNETKQTCTPNDNPIMIPFALYPEKCQTLTYNRKMTHERIKREIQKSELQSKIIKRNPKIKRQIDDFEKRFDLKIPQKKINDEYECIMYYLSQDPVYGKEIYKLWKQTEGFT